MALKLTGLSLCAFLGVDVPGPLFPHVYRPTRVCFERWW